ncbi:lipopolysaccharide biosynthesis protein [Hymenobacter cellulosivorans]|uniref:Lipopolysaccharide biosynthesis protein n=1 Tax=Hymenobacter cellulosivorans TaxID=2932249 RepID=A0ABY4F3G4_9BACT|nr:lipopolysaccharide biosynthesis protein [Hymenobacter cellulosivorans]UOQ50810.1 lipopolysaccharide biosynthesis protein [Hymenobacter cellulosivorans]
MSTSTVDQPRPSLTMTTVQGVKWSTAATILTAIMQVGYTAIMARLLTPAAFGVVALANVVLRFGGYFAQMGMEQAIIQKQELTREDVRAAFTASVLLGIVFGGLLILLAPLSVYIFHEPEVVPVAQALALSLLLTGLSATALSLLRRTMQFRTLALVEVSSYIVSYGGVGVSMALSGYGVWSLVAASVAQGLLVGLLAYLVTRHSVVPLLSWAHYQPLWSYGSRISLISFLEFIGSSLDTLIIGRVLGTALLGVYNRAWMLVSLPMYMLTTSVSKVIFPAFSQVQADADRLRKVYLSSVTLVAAFILPTAAGMMVAAPELVYSLLGPKWGDSIPLLRVMSFTSSLMLLTMFGGIVSDARARLREKTIIILQYLLILPGLFWLLHGWGLMGYALALNLGALLYAGLFMRLLHNDLAIRYGQLLSIYVPGLFNAAVIASVLAGVQLVLNSWQLPPVVSLLVLMLVGGLVLGTLILLVPLPGLRRELSAFLDRLEPQSHSGVLGRLLARYVRFLNPTRYAPTTAYSTANPVLP